MSLFHFGKRNPPAPKQFLLSNTFEYIFQCLLMICASDRAQYITIGIDADAHGKINLVVTGEISFFPHMLRSIDPSVEKYFCNSNHYSCSGSWGTLRFQFSEPDCYIYGCPEGPFLDEVTEFAPNGYLDFFHKFPNGNMSITVKFHPRDFEQQYEALKKLKEWCNIWLS